MLLLLLLVSTDIDNDDDDDLIQQPYGASTRVNFNS